MRFPNNDNEVQIEVSVGNGGQGNKVPNNSSRLQVPTMFVFILFVLFLSGIHPQTHSVGMISWFPIFFPIKVSVPFSWQLKEKLGDYLFIYLFVRLFYLVLFSQFMSLAAYTCGGAHSMHGSLLT